MNALIGALTEALNAAPAWVARLAEASVKISLLLVAAALAALALKAASAGMKHLLWTAALGAALLVPVLALTLPGWSVPVLPAVAASTSLPLPVDWSAELDAEVAQPPEVTEFESMGSLGSLGPASEAADGASALRAAWAQLVDHPWLLVCVWLLAMWASGAALVLLKLVFDHLQMFALVMRSAPLSDQRQELADAVALKMGLSKPVRLFESPEVAMPMIWGFGQPVVLLPAQSSEWTTARLELVLLHELAHVKRGDALTQLMAQLACALYWFHPMVWFAAKRMRQLREYACDDTVLAQGALPSDYAAELLSLVRTLDARRVNAATVGMAQCNQLYQRVTAILDGARMRQSLLWSRAGLFVLAGALVVPIAVMAPTAVAAPDGNLPRLSKDESAKRKNPEAAVPAAAAAPQLSPEPALAPEPAALAHGHQGHSAAECSEAEVGAEPASSGGKQIVGGMPTDAHGLKRLTRDDSMDHESSRQALVSAAQKLADDDDRATVFRALLINAPTTERTGRAVLGVAAGMKSPDAVLRVLEMFHRIRESNLVRGPLASQYLDIAQRLPSEQLSKALTAQLHHSEVPSEITLRALNVIGRLSDAEQKLAVMQEITDHQRIDPSVDAAFRAIVSTLPENERQEALSELEEARQRNGAKSRWALSMKTPGVNALYLELQGLKEQERTLKVQEKMLRQQARELEQAAEKLREAIEKQTEGLKEVEVNVNSDEESN